MFDLNQAIGEWRQQMLAAGIQTPVPLEELEIHLREEVEQRMKSGTGEQEAFAMASALIGQPEPLKSEFKKAGGIFENGIMKKFKPVIYIAVAHYALWWILWGILHLPHFGLNEMFDGGFFGGKPEHPVLYFLSGCVLWLFYFLNLPMLGLWDWFDSHSGLRWLGWLLVLPLNSLIWGVILGGFLNWFGDKTSARIGKRKIGISLIFLTIAATLGLLLIGVPLVVHVRHVSVQGALIADSLQLPWYSFMVVGLFVASMALVMLPKRETLAREHFSQ
jgi:hypothetical protein